LFTKNKKKNDISFEKSEKATFFAFSQNQVFEKKCGALALFPTRYDRWGSNVFISASIALGCVFFCLNSVVSMKFVTCYKIDAIEKTRFLILSSVF